MSNRVTLQQKNLKLTWDDVCKVLIIEQLVKGLVTPLAISLTESQMSDLEIMLSQMYIERGLDMPELEEEYYSGFSKTEVNEYLKEIKIDES